MLRVYFSHTEKRIVYAEAIMEMMNSWESCGRTYALGREDWSTGALSRWVKALEKAEADHV